MGKAAPEVIDYAHMYHGLKRAHEFSGIGQVSNNLTKLWNRPKITKESRDAADFLSCYNNYVIDAAKTGLVNSYESYPEVCRMINKAIGGKRSKMPFFFQYSKNGRREEKRTCKYSKKTGSTMNRLCSRFEDIGNINMNYANVAPFNWQMMLADNNAPYIEEAVRIFCDMDSSNSGNLIASTNCVNDVMNELNSAYEIMREMITETLEKKFGSLEAVYPSVTKYLFAGANANKQFHKSMYWRVFGHIAKRCLQNNLEHCTVCDKCLMKVPEWASSHECPGNAKGFLKCSDCGTVCIRSNSRQIRCKACQDLYFRKYKA